LGNFRAIGSLARLALGARARKKLTLSQQSDAILALSCENASRNRQFASAQKMSRLRLLDSVVHITLNASEVTFMALTANALAKKLGCAWVTIKRAIKRNELPATWDSERREWLVEEGRELVFFCARLDYLRHVRRERAERMKLLWKVGRLKPRRRKQVPTVVIERLKRPSLLSVGQGIGTRTMPIVWRSDQEGESHCPACGMTLKVR
jgi:hypothetical protein